MHGVPSRTPNAGALRIILAMASHGAVAPAKTGVQETPGKNWVPAFTGTTDNDLSVVNTLVFDP